MAELLLGPLLRYVDQDTATVWVETDRPCTAEVVCDGAGAVAAVSTARTWQIAGHHYALVTVAGLGPGTCTPYRVLLDGHEVWPLPGSSHPPSTIRTLPNPVDADCADVADHADHADQAGGRAGHAGERAALRVAFGSCRWAATPSDSSHDLVGPDVLNALAARIAAEPNGERPDVLLLLGDQVYADETSEATRQWLATRRDLREPPGGEVVDFEEYTRLYYESWLDPDVRWLLSTVPSCMIFDDHDVIDDWNTSAAWLEQMRATTWWEDRVLAGLMSYWVYQHLGNLSPTKLAADPLLAAVQAAEDGAGLVREFAAQADADPAYTRWSYRRDFGRVRLLMLDTRAARVLAEPRRAMIVEREWAWLCEQVPDCGPGGGPSSSPGSSADNSPGGSPCAYDHLLIGTSLPWLLPPAIHDAERWNAALCAGARGPRWARFAEAVRQLADLEHWAAFPSSFDALTELVAEASRGSDRTESGAASGAPATVCVLSGDVHHAYVAEPQWSAQPAARVVQLTCSPLHNSVPASIRFGFRFGWSRAARWLGQALARHGRLERPSIRWRRTGGPWFGNQLMTLTLRGRGARVRLDQAQRGRDGTARLVAVLDTEISTMTGTTTGTETGTKIGIEAGTKTGRANTADIGRHRQTSSLD